MSLHVDPSWSSQVSLEQLSYPPEYVTVVQLSNTVAQLNVVITDITESFNNLEQRLTSLEQRISQTTTLTTPAVLYTDNALYDENNLVAYFFNTYFEISSDGRYPTVGFRNDLVDFARQLKIVPPSNRQTVAYMRSFGYEPSKSHGIDYYKGIRKKI